MLQRFGGDGSFAVDPAQVGLVRSGGQPLPGALLAKMEAALGADFSGVRVHVGPQASRIGALAFTTGNDLYFAPGQYQPDSVKGQQLIGHELAHVVQQRQGRVRAPGSGVAVVQDRALEAEADRLGMKAAAHRLPVQMKRATPFARVVRHQAHAHLQRVAIQRSSMFAALKPAERMDTDDVCQTDLVGNSQSGGRVNLRYCDQDAYATAVKTYVTSTSQVVSFLKVNGNYYAFGQNGKADSNIEFEGMGYENQKGLKKNPHAEDWTLQAFRSAYSAWKNDIANTKKGMDDWLNDISPSSSNVGDVNKKHVVSLRINFSSCLGCVATIKGFNQYLQAELPKKNYVMRVKFLRPYDLSVKTSNVASSQAQNFMKAIGELESAKIPVRFQPITSAQSMSGIKVPHQSKTAVEHDGVDAILNSGQYTQMTKTWKERGVSRTK